MAQGATRLSPMMAAYRGIARRAEIGNKVLFEWNAPIRKCGVQHFRIEIAKGVRDQRDCDQVLAERADILS